MSRIMFLAVLALLYPVQADAAPKPEGKKPLYVRIQDEVRIKAVEDPKTTLGEVLAQLTMLHELPFDVDEKAFREAGNDNPLRSEIAITPIPEMKVRVDTYLTRLLGRVPVEGGATFTIRRDRIEITTVNAQRAEFFPNQEEGPYFPLVNADFEKTPLDAALKQLADQTESTIVLDTRAIDKDAPTVTARLANTPLDSAIIILAEMTDLRPVRMGKTILVTSPKKAEALEKRLRPQPENWFGWPVQPMLGGALNPLGGK